MGPQDWGHDPLGVPFSKEQCRKVGLLSWTSKGQACDVNTGPGLRGSVGLGVAGGCGLSASEAALSPLPQGREDVGLEPFLPHLTSQAEPPGHKLQAGVGLETGGRGQGQESEGWSYTQISLRKRGQLLSQHFGLMSRAQFLECTGGGGALAAPWSLSHGGGPATLAS